MRTVITASGGVELGRIPRIVGTVSTPEGLQAAAGNPPACDLIEVRLDRMGTRSGLWVSSCRRIEQAGKPVIVTVRLDSEGGGWQGEDRDREPVFREALEHVSVIDVEYHSRLRRPLTAAAASAGRVVVLSYHHFRTTPPLPELQAIVRDMLQEPHVVAKIATTVSRREHLHTLLELLLADPPGPLAVIAMGDEARFSRVLFPCLGSALTYGFLDQPAAPGQVSWRDLSELLARLLPPGRYLPR